MKIQLRLFASLSKYLPEPGKPDFLNWLDIEEGTSIADVLNHLKIPENQPTILFVNGLHAYKTTILKNGDRVGIFPPLAGG